MPRHETGPVLTCATTTTQGPTADQFVHRSRRVAMAPLVHLVFATQFDVAINERLGSGNVFCRRVGLVSRVEVH